MGTSLPPATFPGLCKAAVRVLWLGTRSLGACVQFYRRKQASLPKHGPILCSHPTFCVKQSYNLGLPPRNHQEAGASLQGASLGSPREHPAKHKKAWPPHLAHGSLSQPPDLQLPPKSPGSERTQCGSRDDSLRREVLRKPRKSQHRPQ